MKRSALALAALVLTLIAVIASGAFAEDPHVERPTGGRIQVATERPASPGVDAYEKALGYVEAQRVGAYIEAVAENDRVLAAMGAVRDNINAYVVAMTPPPPPPPPVVQPTYAPVQSAPPPSSVSGACGGATNGADQFIQRESGGDPNALNPSGAWGCYQLMPEHFAPGGSCDDMSYGSATPAQQAECASRLPLSAWAL